ncbi:MAG: hypothetical protein QNL62_25065 [Gammaproteobacteria bacterium]|nr:hypothetical protein [Gammaproteobacteria bacterium]
MNKTSKNKYKLTIPDYVILSGAVVNVIVITTLFIFWLIYS